MNNFEKKYGVKNCEKTKRFHKNRRMFAIRDGKLYLAQINVQFSHVEWFEQEGWISTCDASEMDFIIRGYVNESGIYVYRGWDFKFNLEDISILLRELPKIINILGLSKEIHLYGGMRINSNGEMIPSKDFGALGGLVNV